MFSARPAMSAALLLALALPAGSIAASVVDPQAERTIIGEWRAQRLAELTSDSGWLTLTGLFWLK